MKGRGGVGGGAAVVLAHRMGAVGEVELNRPAAINALDLEMVRLLQPQVDAWREDERVRAVLLSGRGDRGLCAGGDVVALRQAASEGRREGTDFLREEYRLNHAIATFPKPWVSFMDGIVMGGGIGLSSHGSHRIVTERTRVAMPETSIGLIPDVGGTWLLSHAPGELGTHLALTAGTVGSGDAIALGLADRVVPHDQLAALRERLRRDSPESAIAAFEAPVPVAPMVEDRAWIDECYEGDDATAIVDRLLSHRSQSARAAGELLATRSPLSVIVTLRALRNARAMSSLAEALTMELRLTARLIGLPDFLEGVRAQLVDKDRMPCWAHASLAEVDPASLDWLFDPLPEGDLALGVES